MSYDLFPLQEATPGHKYRNFIETHVGRRIDLSNPELESIDIVDIGVSLSRQARFYGHTYKFYSVAEHSYHAAVLAEHSGQTVLTALACLLHDASEAYLGDMVRPLKLLLGDKGNEEYARLQSLWEFAIDRRFGLRGELGNILYDPDVVTKIDMRLLATEAKGMMLSRGTWWSGLPKSLDTKMLRCWCHDEAYDRFMYKYTQLVLQLLDKEPYPDDDD